MTLDELKARTEGILKTLDREVEYEPEDTGTVRGNAFTVKLWITGDWKHDHGYTDSLFTSAGFTAGQTDIEDTGEDWYKSLHTYTARITEGGER